MAGLPASEFGGRPMRVGVQPPPHVPSADEQLSLIYRTGDASGQTPSDGGLSFAGLLDSSTQRQLRETEGVLTKGEEWEAMQGAAVDALAELAGGE